MKYRFWLTAENECRCGIRRTSGETAVEDMADLVAAEGGEGEVAVMSEETMKPLANTTIEEIIEGRQRTMWELWNE